MHFKGELILQFGVLNFRHIPITLSSYIIFVLKLTTELIIDLITEINKSLLSQFIENNEREMSPILIVNQIIGRFHACGHSIQGSQRQK